MYVNNLAFQIMCLNPSRVFAIVFEYITLHFLRNVIGVYKEQLLKW